MRKCAPVTLQLLTASLLFSAWAYGQTPEELNPPFCLFSYGACTPGTTSGGLFYAGSGAYYYTPGIYFFTPGVYFFTPGTYYVFPDPMLKQDVDGVIQNLLRRRTGSRTDPVGSKLYQVHCNSSSGKAVPGNSEAGSTRAAPTALNLDGWQAAIFSFTTGPSLTLLPGPGVSNPPFSVLGAEFSGINLENPGTHIATGLVTSSNGATTGFTFALAGVDQTWQTLSVSPGGSTCTLAPLLGLGPAPGIRTFRQTDPVSTADGELVIPAITDFYLGGPLPLFLHREYTSLQVENSFVGSLGFNWMTNYDPYIITTSNTAVVIAEGGRVTFQLVNGAFQMAFPATLPYQLIRTSSGQYRFFDPRQNLIFTFNSSGGLIRIEDRNGNALTVTQGSAGPIQVSDGRGRSLNFAYTGTKISTITDQTGRSITYGRNGNLLASVTDANGNLTSYSYEANFGITTTRRPRGNIPYTQVYNGFTQVVQQTDSAGNKSTISYVSGGTAGLNTLTDSMGRTTTFSYPNLLDAGSFTDASGAAAFFTSDSAHRPLTATDRLGNKTSVTYDPAGGDPASITDAQGNTTSFTWQAQAQGGFTFRNLARITYPDNTTKTFTYDASGNPLTITDRAGKTTAYTYNPAGQVLTETNPAGGVTTFTYNADGTLATVKDPAGNVTTYSYDSLKRVAKIQYADSTSRSFTRDAMDRILSVTDERGNVTKFAYDANDNLQSVTDALAKSAAISYDADDLPVSSTDRLGNKTSYQYDPLGSATAITDPLGKKFTFSYDNLERLQSAADPAGKTTRYGYDAEGRLTSVTDALGNQDSIQVDQQGRPVQYTSPLGETTRVAYDSSSRIAGVTDALGEQSSFAYEPRGLASSITLPGGIATSFAWSNLPVLASVTDANGSVWPIATDSLGRVTSSTDPLGRAVKLTYDSRNRVASLTSPIDSAQLSHDGAGNLTQAQYSDGVALTYAYDSDNRLVSGTGFSFTRDAEGQLTGSNGLSITRDALGRILTITYASSKTVTYSYDPRGLLANVSDWTGASVAFTFDDAQRLVSVSRPNGVAAAYTYDNDSRVVSITETAGGTSLSSIVLTRDAIGRVTSAARNIPQEASPAPANSSAAFDAASQTSGATYDARGRLTGDNAGSTYKWNAASRLLSYSRPDGSASATYDGLGQRISRTGADGAKRNYVIDYATGLPTVAIAQSGSSDLTYYVYTPDGSLLFSIDAASGAHRYYSFDETGSTIFLTGDNGGVTDSYGISPYGDVVTAGAGNSTDNPFTWQGEFGVMQEPGTRLYYVRFRYYDASSERFLSRDPVLSPSPREVNPYQYAGGDPVTNADPMGLKSAHFPGLFPVRFHRHLRKAGDSRFTYSIAYDPAFYNILLNVSTSAPSVFLSTSTGSVFGPGGLNGQGKPDLPFQFDEGRTGSFFLGGPGFAPSGPVTPPAAPSACPEPRPRDLDLEDPIRACLFKFAAAASLHR